MATEPVLGPEAREAEPRPAHTRPTFWQRRYLLSHYREFDDAALARGSGLPEWVVRGFLERHGATRSAGDAKRIEKRGPQPPRVMFTWSRARAAMTRLESRPLERQDVALIGALLVGSLMLYGLTCARTVTGEDAGDFLSAAHGFGVPHPPGYPLWLLLAWSADHVVGWVSTAWRVAMVSAVFSAIANALFLAVLLKTLRSRLAAVTAAALFAVSRTHWTQAVIPEVYGLNTFFIAAQAFLLVWLADRPSPARLLLLAGITGLSATNHTSALPVGLLVVLAALLIAPQLFRRPAVLGGALVAGLLPLALYLVLPLASAQHPYDDWGHTSEPGGLWHHMTRAQYAEVEAEEQSVGGYDDYLHRLGIMAEWGGKQFGSGWVLLLAALGVGALFLRQTGLWLFLIALGWMNSVGITRYTAFPFEREHVYAVQIFWIPAWLSLAWFLGGGLDTILGWIRRLEREGTKRLATASAGAACLVLVALPAARHYPVADRSRTTLIADFGQAILNAMEPNALYFPSSDHSTFSVMYWQAVEHARADVVIADKYGRIEPELLARYLTPDERAAEAQLPGRERRALEEAALVRHWPGPVYFANRRESGDLKDLTLEAVGPVFKVMTAEQREAWWKPGTDGSPSPGLLASDRCANLLQVDERQRLDFTVQMVHGDMLYMRGLAQLSAGDMPGALATWETIHGDLAPLKQGFNNIGAALADAKHLPEAETFFERARQEDPRYTLCLRNEALVCRNRGEPDKAIDLLYKLVEIEPRQRDGRMELARLLDTRDRPIEALEQYEALATADENDPMPWRAAAELLARRGDAKKASEAWREVVRLVPNDPDAQRGLDQLSEAPMVMAPSPPMGLTAAADESDVNLTPPAAAPPPAAVAPRGPIEQWGFDPERRPAVPPR
jgi:tetratricopeptide (TPR) repeat protein